MTTALELLIQARELFIEKGGAKSKYYDSRTDQYCAIGAIKKVAGYDYALVSSSWTEKFTQNEIESLKAVDMLNSIADVWYYQDIAWVNDNIGTAEVIRCYDRAITMLERAD